MRTAKGWRRFLRLRAGVRSRFISGAPSRQTGVEVQTARPFGVIAGEGVRGEDDVVRGRVQA
jgi:hypothetical protein